MEKDRLEQEAAEKAKQERARQIKEQFADPNSQWDKDKADVQNLAAQEKAKVKTPEQKPAAAAANAQPAAAGAAAAA